jgi:hypothetical protein
MTAEVKGTKKTATETIAEAGLAEALEEKVLDFEHQIEIPLGEPTEKLEAYTARWGDAVIANEAIVVSLPRAERANAGRLIPIKNLSNGTVTVRAVDQETIDGITEDHLIPSEEGTIFQCIGEGKWIELSAHNPYGEIYIASSAATTLTLAATYYVVAGTYAAGELYDFHHDTNGRLELEGSGTRRFHVTCSFSFEANKADVYNLRLAVNGITLAKTEIDRNIAVGGVNTVGAAAIQGLIELEAGDYIELWAATTAQTNAALTVRHMNLIAR